VSRSPSGAQPPARRHWLRGILGAAAAAALPRGIARAGESAKKAMNREVGLYYGEALGRYGFPAGHPLGVDRQGAFYREAVARGLDKQVSIAPGRSATRAEIERFHTRRHVDLVEHAERDRIEFLDNGDTPSFPGVYEASATVVGSALDGLASVMSGRCRRTFQPVGGLHHARRDGSAGFCVFNDLGVVIETLRSEHAIRRVAYVDIDVHHGDGVFYAYESDPELIFADVHEDGRFLYPGTGRADETGKGRAKGTKLNIALAPGAGDREFIEAWPRVVAHLRAFRPEFFVFQCGADGLDGDPLAHLRYSPQVHAHAARSLSQLADEFSGGRIMAFGGGGYDRGNLARAWCAVLGEFVS
jgi:acetoin utilization protein AcuC